MNERTIFIAALQSEPGERNGYLDQACGADGALRRRVVIGEDDWVWPDEKK